MANIPIGYDEIRKVIYNGTIITMNDTLDVIENGYLLIEGNRIKEIGSGKPPEGGYRIDAGGRLVLPGLINTHTHIPMTIFRGIANDMDLHTWLHEYIWPAEKKFIDEKNVRIGTQLGIVEMLRSGTTTFNDMYFFEHTIAEEVEKSGIRAVLGEAILDFPVNSYQTIDEALALSEDFIRRYHEHPTIHPSVSAHSPYACCEETLKKTKALALKYNVPYHIHLSETKDEVVTLEEKKGMKPMEYFASIGILDKLTIGAHCVWVSAAEVDLCCHHQLNISHNPTSNLKLGSGIAPVSTYLKKKINVALGTDGAASNNTLDLFQELKLAAILHKGATHDPQTINAVTALKMATVNGAKALNLDHITGSLEEGKRADIIMVDTHNSGAMPLYDYYAAIVYALNSASVSTVMVDGKILLQNGILTTLDETAIFNAAKTLQKEVQLYIKKLKQQRQTAQKYQEKLI